ncbi:LVIVD repeat-containing protein [Nonlabens xiamenensis]|uniref:hypothetical protein n=1 Tax=Nonlabens xiamenensis TaxID=2341043 RepID=UPI000F60D72C|nr:hypothetical protein [Nonlabens xiamenensis]
MNRIIFLIALATLAISCSADSDSTTFNDQGTGQGGSLARFIIVEDYLYTVDEESLHVFDIHQAEAPVKVNSQYIGFGIETIYSFENTLFLGSQLGMYIYGLDDPTSPQLLSEANHLRSCDPVVSNYNYTFVSLHTNATCQGQLNQLEVYETSDLTHPVLLGTMPFERPIGMGIYQDYLILSDLDKIRFLDITNPRSIHVVYQITADTYDVIVRGHQLFAIGPEEIIQFDLDPAQISNTTMISRLTY